jgi:UDP-N-acetylmuramoyl-tripeptide--D-alanyl-D-alanine ligase
MRAALENFSGMQETHKTVIIGDMFELGETAAEEHQAIADLVKELGFESAYLVGENFFRTQTPLQKYRTFEDLSTPFLPSPFQGYFVDQGISGDGFGTGVGFAVKSIG